MSTAPVVAVYGATGHTGRFVIGELRRRGITAIASGRDGERLAKLAAEWGDVAVRPASVDDPEALDRVLTGADAVINTAGPFAVTGGPLAAAAVRAGIPYLDVAAEIEANLQTFADHAGHEGAHILPAMAFYGGLGDLLATAAAGEWTSVDEVHVAYGLSSWRPTAGTREAGKVSHERRGGRRLRFTGGALQHHDDPMARQDWDFGGTTGTRPVYAEFSMADIVTVPTHLDAAEVRTYMTVTAAGDLADADTPAPEAADESGLSDQTFVVDVRVRKGGEERRATASGRDIYGVTAPLVVEAAERILTGRTRVSGLASAGAMFDAADFLRALAPHVTVELP